jgi:hypothetical protein
MLGSLVPTFIPDEFAALASEHPNGRLFSEIGKFGRKPRDRPATRAAGWLIPPVTIRHRLSSRTCLAAFKPEPGCTFQIDNLRQSGADRWFVHRTEGTPYSLEVFAGVLVSATLSHLGQVNTCLIACSAAMSIERDQAISVLHAVQIGAMSPSIGCLRYSI